MFGNLGAFVNGNMFMGLFGPEVGLKLPEAEAHQVVASGGGPFGPAERPMTGSVSLSAGIAAGQARRLAAPRRGGIGREGQSVVVIGKTGRMGSRQLSDLGAEWERRGSVRRPQTR